LRVSRHFFPEICCGTPVSMEESRSVDRVFRRQANARPRFPKPEPGAPSVSRYFREKCRSDLLSATSMSTHFNPTSRATRPVGMSR